MDLYRLINLICLCVVNGFFTLAGIFLNSVVIISLWKSSLVRKGTCYFMILVLSCFDLGLVMVGHPTTISSTLAWATGDNSSAHWTKQHGNSYHMGEIARILANFAQGFSMYALLTLTIDRYLAITRPFFHQTSITKRRLLAILVTLLLPFIVARVLRFFKDLKTVYYIAHLVISGIFLLPLGLMNCRMFAIATRRKRSMRGRNSKAWSALLKKNSTCFLTVGCFYISIIPFIVYIVLRVSSDVSEDVLLLIRLWANTSLTLSSSINCTIFFWKNEVLRKEGKKLLTSCIKNTR